MSAEVADFVLTHTESGGVAVLTLNRPSQYNALSSGMIAALTTALNGASKDPSVRAMILTGAGKGFCAGHDLKELREIGDARGYALLMKSCRELMHAIQSVHQPVIARVHGVATAAGCQLAAACDLAVASSDSHFATPGVLIGLFCSTPMVELTRNVPRKKAFEMLLTGERINAEEALRFGLINRHVPTAELESATLALARQIASRAPYTVSIGKKAFYAQSELGIDEAYEYASRIMVENLQAAEAVEGISAFLEKRQPDWNKPSPPGRT